MKIKMKVSISGTFHNIDGGVRIGDVVDIDDQSAANYMEAGYAEAVNQDRRSFPEEHAVQGFSKEERAVLDTEIIGAASSRPIPQPRAPRPPKAEAEVVDGAGQTHTGTLPVSASDAKPSERKAVTTKDVSTPTKRTPPSPRRR